MMNQGCGPKKDANDLLNVLPTRILEQSVDQEADLGLFKRRKLSNHKRGLD